jgi:hypothetical protein
MMNGYKLLTMLFMLISIDSAWGKKTIELSAPNKEERELFVNPLLMAMNPMLNPMAMHFPLNSDKKYKIKHNLHVVHGPYGMNPYMMHMNPYMMGMMNPYMMGMMGMMNPYMMGYMNPMMMGGMGMMHMNPYMMGMMNPYMMGAFGGYHPYNIAHPLHPFNPMGMYGMGMFGPMGGAYLHTTAHHDDDEAPEDRKLVENGTEDIDQKMMETMEQEKKDAAKGGIQLNF